MAVVQNKQVRGFAVIWTGITMIVGIATFFGIYLAYDGDGDNLFGENSVGLPVIPTETAQQVAQVVSTNTDVPPPTATNTLAPTNTETVEPTEEIVEQADDVTSAQSVDDTANDDDTDTNGREVAQASTPESEPTIAPTPLPVSDRSFQLAIQVQPVIDGNPDVQRVWMDSVRGLGLQWFKQQIRWNEIELEPGEYDWGRLDISLNMASEYGFNVLASIVAAPEWARPEGMSPEREGPPEDTADFTNFLTELLNRYPGQIHAIEVWNEQNLDREWTSMLGLSATNYVSLLRDTYNMIQEVSPGTIVISGALSPTGLDDGIGAIDDFRYMQLMIDAGLLDVTDCVGAHHNGYNIGPLVPYDNVPNDPTAGFRGPFDNPHHSWSFRSTLDGYISRIRNAGSDTKLCITEFGWAVTEDLSGTPRGFEFADDNTLEEQATFFVDALESMSSGDDVWLAFIWNLNYGPQAGWDPTNDNVPYSLIGPDNTFRPAYDAIRDWAAANQQ